MTSQLIASVAAAALIGIGFAGADGTRSAEVMPALKTGLAGTAEADGADNKCRVDVKRTGPLGTADITRLVENDGTCVCIVTTGQAAGNGTAEDVVTALLRDRTCDGAPAAIVNPGPGQIVSGAAAGGGGSGVILPVVITAVGAAGLAVAVGNDSKG